MGFTQRNVLRDYLRGVKNLIGKEMVDEDLKKFILGFKYSAFQDSSNIYYLITRELIDKKSSKRCGLSERLKDGLAEDIAIRISDLDDSMFDNERKLYNTHWVEFHISRILLDVIGSREGAICVLKRPDLLGELLSSIPYQSESLLEYLNAHLDKAVFEFNLPDSSLDLGHSVEAVNCCEAISDCSSRLQLPKRRLEKKKILAKFRKNFEGKGHGQEI